MKKPKRTRREVLIEHDAIHTTQWAYNLNREEALELVLKQRGINPARVVVHVEGEPGKPAEKERK